MDVPPPSRRSKVVRSTISLGLVTSLTTSTFGGSAETTSTLSADTRPELSDMMQICSPGIPTGGAGHAERLGGPVSCQEGGLGRHDELPDLLRRRGDDFRRQFRGRYTDFTPIQHHHAARSPLSTA